MSALHPESSTDYVYDYIIVGAGPVGATVTDYLRTLNKTVLLIERGGAEEQKVGNPDLSQQHDGYTNGRAEGWGGTSSRWGGQIWRWDEWELRSREILNNKSWPVDFDDLDWGYRWVASAWKLRPRQMALITGEWCPDSAWPYTRFSTWLSPRSKNIWKLLRRDILRSGNVRTLTGTVKSFREQPDGFVTVTVDDGNGEQYPKGKRLLLCAGTVGNIDLLKRAGANSPMIGRQFIDHVSARAFRCTVADWQLFKQNAAPLWLGRARYSPRYLPPEPESWADRGANTFAHWEVQGGILHEIKMFQKAASEGSMRQAVNAASQIGRHAPQFIWSMLVNNRWHTQGDVFLRVDVEQLPDEGHSLDPNGKMPVNWTVAKSTEDRLDQFCTILKNEFPWEFFGVQSYEPLSDHLFSDTYHMMGGAALGRSSDQSVVDPDGLLHGSSRTYVYGACTFPTGGVANPTLTASALAVAASRRVLLRTDGDA